MKLPHRARIARSEIQSRNLFSLHTRRWMFCAHAAIEVDRLRVMKIQVTAARLSKVKVKTTQKKLHSYLNMAAIAFRFHLMDD